MKTENVTKYLNSYMVISLYDTFFVANFYWHVFYHINGDHSSDHQYTCMSCGRTYCVDFWSLWPRVRLSINMSTQ